MTIPASKQLTITVKGIVQGVGYRPFVYASARKLGLAGSVANSGRGVEIVVSGASRNVDEFINLLKKAPPPLAHVSELSSRETSCELLSDEFTIVDSQGGEVSTLISPDIAICDDCLRDIFSPDNRRFHYPFTNCTNCGPRLTIIDRMPYDRKFTSMASFPMCAACESEYNDPANRRFHAQPNACPDCGPQLSWLDSRGKRVDDSSGQELARCARALKEGAIVAIKGLGGFHLVVDASSDQAVQRLRARKQRQGKPLAVMVATLAAAQKIGVFNNRERELLLSRERPIVLVRKQTTSGLLSPAIAPGLCELGIMLPYTPLHHLLFAMSDCPEQLVMTSGNLSGEPICIENSEAVARLAPVADYFLVHNRDIVTRVDDSVVRVIRGKVQMIRRSRGYVPLPIPVAGSQQAILACGAELKNSFSLSRAGAAFFSQHIGDLNGPAAMDFFEESVRYMQDVLAIEPRLVACDLHPDYLSSRYAHTLELPCIPVQHHHAHAASILAEHGLEEGLAVIFDGVGLGDDGTIWGGEFLHVKGAACERLGHLAPLQLPGGDLASREPWRMGLALLAGAGVDISDSSALPESLQGIPAGTVSAIRQMMELKINAPTSSSIGRLFDGVASLLGIRQSSDFEGQAAMELEALAWGAYEGPASITILDRYTASIRNEGEALLLDYRPLVHWLLEDLAKGVSVAELAFLFHLWLVRSTGKILLHLLARHHTTDNILLGGGCFQNRMLFGFLNCRLKENGFTMYSNEQIPVNDGGLALGQLYIAEKITEVDENVSCYTNASG